jgi:hypothetical protein
MLHFVRGGVSHTRELDGRLPANPIRIFRAPLFADNPALRLDARLLGPQDFLGFVFAKAAPFGFAAPKPLAVPATRAPGDGLLSSTGERCGIGGRSPWSY